MAKITTHPDLSNITDPNEFMARGSGIVKDTVDQVNGGLEFDKNLNTQTVSVVFPTANTDVAVSHNLGRTGVKYFIGGKSVDCSVFDGSRAQTKTTIYLRSTQPATVTVVLF